MTECPKCNSQLEDGTKFCSNCGAQIFETIFCSNCGKQTSTEFAFCQSCGASMAEESKAEEKKTAEQEIPATGGASSKGVKNPMPKKPPFKLAALALAALVVIGIGAFALKGLGGSSKADYLLYVKEDELYINDFSKNGAKQVSSKLFKGISLEDSANLGDFSMMESFRSFSDYTRFSEDGKILFYVDKFEIGGLSYSLYYKDAKKPEAEGTRIDKNVVSYSVDDKATRVVYLKEESSLNLYEYNLKKNDKEKIAKDVASYRISKDGNSIFYTNSDGIYVKLNGKEAEKIDKEGYPWIIKVSEDFKTVYYLAKDTLYKYEVGKESEKIASDIYDVIQLYNSGEIYYIKDKEKKVKLIDYVEDDKKESDERMVEPEYPSYPSYFTFFGNEEQYQAALDAYDEKYEKYQKDYEEYQKKISRDGLRRSLASREIQLQEYILCYFDGSEEKVITETMASGGDQYVVETFYATASDTPVIAFKSYNETEVEKVKLSEISDYYDEYLLEALIQSSLYSSSSQYVAIKDLPLLMAEESGNRFAIDKNGKEIYFLKAGEDESTEGDLYKVTIGNGKLSEAELYDQDVSSHGPFEFIEDMFVYSKETDEYAGHLYANKEKVDEDVDFYYAAYYGGEENYGQFDSSDYENSDLEFNEIKYDPREKRFIYFTDLSEDGGTLKIYQKGKSESVSDGVVQFKILANGNILYLKDYEGDTYSGDLYLFKNGKSEKIDENVNIIINKNEITQKR